MSEASSSIKAPLPGNPDSSEVLTPDLLISCIRSERLRQAVRVRGVARKVSPWSNGKVSRCYGEIEHGETSLSFCLLSEPSPHEGEAIIVAGVLTLGHKKLAIEVRGELAGGWMPLHREAKMAVPTRTEPALPLTHFMTQYPLSSLGFLTSKTAWEDICTAAGLLDIRQCTHIQVNFGDEKAFIEDMGHLLENGAQGIVVARGGGEKLEAIGNSAAVTKALVEAGLPFYVALGHSNDVLLLDKHADESFVSPSDLAHRIRACIQAEQDAAIEQKEAENMEIALGHVQAQVTALKGQMTDQERQHQERLQTLLQQHTKEKRRWQEVAIAAIVLLGGLLLWSWHLI